MSLETWKAKFYPVDSKVADKPIEHSLRKWRGLRFGVLEEHGLRVGSNAEYVYEPPLNTQFAVGGEACALCDKYYDLDSDEAPCGACPLAKVRDGVACDDSMAAEYYGPWQVWKHSKDPYPMIYWLQRAQEEYPE